MAGTDTVRGIGYQQAQAVLTAIEVLETPDCAGMRVEGTEDVIDLEMLDASGAVRHGKQIKTRRDRTWSGAEILSVLTTWAGTQGGETATFEFVTDGRLGPSADELLEALRQAAGGDPGPLSDLLGHDARPEICERVARGRISVEPAPIGSLIQRAEVEVAARLPFARTVADAHAEASQAVGRLFQLLMERGGRPAPRDRFVSREEIADTLGVPADHPAKHRWPGPVRDAYLAAAEAMTEDSVAGVLHPSATTSSTLRTLSPGQQSQNVAVSALTSTDIPALVSGRTGTGKTTAARQLRSDAARDGTVVLLAHAEGYLPGRLDALAADALAEPMGAPLPKSTGRQVLADREVVLAIDGASEIPPETTEALATELRSLVATGAGARIVLLGRDMARLRQVLPSSAQPRLFEMADFEPARRLELATRQFSSPTGAFPLHDAGSQLRRVEHALGDAAGNPMLLSMALTLLDEGIDFTNRAGLYDEFIGRLGARTGTADMVVTSATLGVVFARLLDDGRRFADPFEWAQLLDEAAARIRERGVAVEPRAADAAARRAGLISPLGFVQTVVPIHDSFADYLAAAAHARGLVDLPATLQTSDEQRVLFRAEIAGVDQHLASAVARDLPFLAVRLADLDRRPFPDDAGAEVERLLLHLVPDHTAAGSVALWKDSRDRVVASVCPPGTSGWVDERTGRQLLAVHGGVVVEAGGPLAVAVRLWRRTIEQRLPSRRAPVAHPTSLRAARDALEAHTRRTAEVTATLVEAIAPPGHGKALADAVGPVGMTAVVHPEVTDFYRHWPVSYRLTDQISVRVTDDAQSRSLVPGPDLGTFGHSSAEALIDRSPEDTASTRVREAANKLAGERWL